MRRLCISSQGTQCWFTGFVRHASYIPLFSRDSQTTLHWLFSGIGIAVSAVRPAPDEVPGSPVACASLELLLANRSFLCTVPGYRICFHDYINYSTWSCVWRIVKLGLRLGFPWLASERTREESFLRTNSASHRCSYSSKVLLFPFSCIFRTSRTRAILPSALRKEFSITV